MVLYNSNSNSDFVRDWTYINVFWLIDWLIDWLIKEKTEQRTNNANRHIHRKNNEQTIIENTTSAQNVQATPSTLLVQRLFFMHAIELAISVTAWSDLATVCKAVRTSAIQLQYKNFLLYYSCIALVRAA